MSDDRDEITGQYTASTELPDEGLFGREAEEARSGFKQMPEFITEPKPGELDVDEAAWVLDAESLALTPERKCWNGMKQRCTNPTEIRFKTSAGPLLKISHR